MVKLGKVLSLMLASGLCFALPALSPTAEAADESSPARVNRLEESTDSRYGWLDHVNLHGLIEVEASYVNVDSAAPGTDSTDSDLTLSTVALGIDVDIVKHVSGHVLFLWEGDDSEPLEVDEAGIYLDGEDIIPLYLEAGKLYLPFGNFASHFISDPLTHELGETRESAVIAGYTNETLDLSFGVFNGDIDERGDNNRIDNFVASGVFSLPEETVPGLELVAGISWISDLADSNVLQDEIAVSAINNKIDGISAFVSVALWERGSLIAEYLSALDTFEAGELSFDDGKKRRPETWNFEAGYALTDALEIALRYEGGKDLGDLLPDRQYGIVASYCLFENTVLSIEYLHGEFANNDEQDLLTAQFAFEF